MSINLSPLKSAASTSKPWTGSPESNSSSDDLDRHIDVDDGNGRVDRLFDRVPNGKSLGASGPQHLSVRFRPKADIGGPSL